MEEKLENTWVSKRKQRWTLNPKHQSFGMGAKEGRNNNRHSNCSKYLNRWERGRVELGDGGILGSIQAVTDFAIAEAALDSLPVGWIVHLPLQPSGIIAETVLFVSLPGQDLTGTGIGDGEGEDGEDEEEKNEHEHDEQVHPQETRDSTPRTQ